MTRKVEKITVPVGEIDALVKSAWLKVHGVFEREARDIDPLPFYVSREPVKKLDPDCCSFARQVFEFMQSKLAWRVGHFPEMQMKWSVSPSGHTTRMSKSDGEIRMRTYEAGDKKLDGYAYLDLGPRSLSVVAGHDNRFLMLWGMDGGRSSNTLLIVSNVAKLTAAQEKAVMAVIKAVNWSEVAHDVQRANASIRGHRARKVGLHEASITERVTAHLVSLAEPKPVRAANPDLPRLSKTAYAKRMKEIDAAKGLSTGQRAGLKAHATRAYKAWLEDHAEA